MLVSPTEPLRLRNLGSSSSLPERYGSDFLIVANHLRIGVQRKEFPSDFLASLAGDRFYDLVRKMQDLDMAVLIVEGRGRWTEEGNLEKSYGAPMSRQAFYSLIFSLMFQWGIQVFQNGSMDETVAMLEALESWAKKEDHRSLNVRTNVKGDGWGVVKDRDRAVHVLQSWQGVGPEMGGAIYDHFGRLPLRWDVSEKEMLGVRGVGKVQVKRFGEMVEWSD